MKTISSEKYNFFKQLIFHLLLVCLSIQISDAQEGLTEHQQQLKSIFEELVGINTTTKNGNTTIACKAMAIRLQNAGFSENEARILCLDSTRGNLIVRMKGTGKMKPLLLLAHLDVVDANKEEWTYDPFKLVESDGYYYGRGTKDDKSMAAIFISNLIRFKTERFQPQRDIIVCLTSDEENGGPNGLTWLLKEHRDLIEAEYGINECGIGEIINGKYRLNEIQVAEKIYQSYRLSVKTASGHSALPTSDNAIHLLAKGLSRLADYEFPFQLNETTRGYFNVMAGIQTGQTAEDMRAILKNQPDLQAFKRLAQTPYYNALLRTTCVATLIKGGQEENVLPDNATAIVNCRILPDTPEDSVRNTIKKVLANDKIEISPLWEYLNGKPSSLLSEFTELVKKTTKDMWPEVSVIPIMEIGASDGLYLRNAGIPTYGVSGMFFNMDDFREHGKDERVSKKSLYESQEFLYRLVKEFCRDR